MKKSLQQTLDVYTTHIGHESLKPYAEWLNSSEPHSVDQLLALAFLLNSGVVMIEPELPHAGQIDPTADIGGELLDSTLLSQLHEIYREVDLQVPPSPRVLDWDDTDSEFEKALAAIAIDAVDE